MRWQFIAWYPSTPRCLPSSLARASQVNESPEANEGRYARLASGCPIDAFSGRREPDEAFLGLRFGCWEAMILSSPDLRTYQ